jgi:SAM-dependent methyltransferase
MGVEPSELCRKYATERNGIEIIGRYIDDVANGGAYDGVFDLIIMSHVVENIIDPAAALRKVRRLLKPDGHLYIDACNFYYYNAVNPYHPYVFTPESLAALLGVAGFEVAQMFSEPHPRRARWPSDCYFGVVAVAAAEVAPPRIDSVDTLIADQELGVRLYNRFHNLPRPARACCRLLKTVMGERGVARRTGS